MIVIVRLGCYNRMSKIEWHPCLIVLWAESLRPCWWHDYVLGGSLFWVGKQSTSCYSLRVERKGAVSLYALL